MTKKILFVDDDPVFHYIHAKIIKLLGIDCEVRMALNGREALEIVSADLPTRFIPDYIFVDINMPVMDGFRFIQSFRALQPPGKENTVIVIVTSSNNGDDRNRAVRMGIEDYIIKPIKSFDLFRILNVSVST
jgi:CheY-like chemotaxis protein